MALAAFALTLIQMAGIQQRFTLGLEPRFRFIRVATPDIILFSQKHLLFRNGISYTLSAQIKSNALDSLQKKLQQERQSAGHWEHPATSCPALRTSLNADPECELLLQPHV